MFSGVCCVSWLKFIDVSGTISAPIIRAHLMMGTKMVSQTSAIFKQLTRMTAREDFITPTAQCHVYKSSPLFLILSLMNPLHISPTYSLKIYFRIILPFARKYGQDGSVRIATTLRSGRPQNRDLIPDRRKGFFCFPQHSDWL
jgi:hypothetical protein